MIKQRRQNKGFSLLELLLSIAIISLIILMATRYFTTVRSSQQVTAATQFVQGVRAAASAAVSAGVSPTTMNLCTNKNVPAAYCNLANTALISPWEIGSTTPISNVAPAAIGNGFIITVGGVPDVAACNNLYNTFVNEVSVAPAPCSTSAFNPLTLTFNP